MHGQKEYEKERCMCHFIRSIWGACERKDPYEGRIRLDLSRKCGKEIEHVKKESHCSEQ